MGIVVFAAGILAPVAVACSPPKHSTPPRPVSTTAAPAPSPSVTAVSPTSAQPVIPAGNTASAPGITATQITIGSHQPLTGPAAAGFAEIAPAADAYFRYVNDRGGVFGRKIVYKFLDDSSSSATAVSQVRQLVVGESVFAVFNGAGTPTHQATLGFLVSHGVPDLFVGSGCACWNNPNAAPLTFGFQPDDVTEGTILGHFVAATYPGKRVGYLVQNDDFGTGGVAGLDRQIPKASVVSRQTYDPATATVQQQMAALEHAGAQVIVSYSLPTFTALELLAAAQINYHPVFVVSNAGSDIATVTTLLQSLSKGIGSGSLLEGVVTDAYLAPIGDASNPWTQLFKRIHDQYLTRLPVDGNVAYGMAAAYTFVQAMLAAGQNPTRAGVVHAIEASHFAGPGLVPFGYAPGVHSGYSGVEVGTISVGQFRPAGPPSVTTPTGAIRPYTGTPSAPPADGLPARP
jgi:ABC-type branched-subunit amino acid transport system substrate-binding protein